MKKIFGKFKNNQHVVVFDDVENDTLKSIYKVPNVTSAIPFEVDTRPLTEGEWYFVVPTEEQKEEMLGEYVSETSDALLSTILPEHYKEIAAIYVTIGAEKLFTKVTSRQLLQSQKCVAFEEKPRVVEQSSSLLLTGEVDAYWNGSRLFFKKFTFIRSLFPGIHKMYKEITEKGTNEFLSSPLFELKNEMSSDFISLRNRKRMVSIIDGKTIDFQDKELCEKYLDYAKEYNLDLEIEDNKIALIDNSDVAKVLSLLGESFYTTSINGEKREIRSSRKLVHSKRKRAK
jgi:hypothetical protein